MTFYLFIGPIDQADRERLIEAIRKMRQSPCPRSVSLILSDLQTLGIQVNWRTVANIRDLNPQRLAMTEPLNTTLVEGPDQTGPDPIVLTFVDEYLV